jgi:hypothetical protein
MASTPPGRFERCTPGSADHRLRGAAGPYGKHAHTVGLIQLADRAKAEQDWTLRWARITAETGICA